MATVRTTALRLPSRLSLLSLLFLLTTIAAACSIGDAAPVTAATATATALRITNGASVSRVDHGTRPLLAYRHAGSEFKPYVVRLFTPQGLQVLRDAPPDHVHHHAMMFALGLGENIDFWGEVHAKIFGRQLGQPIRSRVVTIAGRGTVGVLEQAIEWVRLRSETVLLHEHRRIEISEYHPGRPTLVSWRSRLSVPRSSATVRIWGRHYFGLGMRFVASMDKTGRFVARAGEVQDTGEVVRGDERLVRSEWCAYLTERDGQPVTVAMFDHPDNPRHPAIWFTMRRPFAYLSATLGLSERPLQIDGENPLRLCYGVALWDGEVSADTIEASYRRWCIDNRTTEQRRN